MWYNIKFKDNLINVKNLSATDELYVTIFITETCDESVFEEVINRTFVDYEEQFKLPYKDGLYKILIQKVVAGVVIEDSEMFYPYYGELLETIIDDIEHFLCNCNCVDCGEDCNKDEKTHLSLLLKLFSYYTLLYKYYPKFYDAVFKCLNCSILDVTKCVLLNEKVTGNTENNELFKKIVFSMYIAFYYAEYYNTSDKAYINAKFKYNKIKKCITIANTNTECITNQIENNMGIFSIQFDRYNNQPPSQVGDYNAGTVPNQASFTITPAMLTSLTTPAYADPEGDAPQAVRIDTLPTNGAILTYNNNPVTVGQIITIADMAANMLKITGPNQSALVASSFRFSIRDIGSMQFTS